MKLKMFPSPYRGYHLSTNITINKKRKLYFLFPSPYRGYHLSTFIFFWFNTSNIRFRFPSPYRGYHLSTMSLSYQKGFQFKKFPSPYRGYHLSTQIFHLKLLHGSSPSFRPLIGVIIFQQISTVLLYRRF